MQTVCTLHNHTEKTSKLKMLNMTNNIQPQINGSLIPHLFLPILEVYLQCTIRPCCISSLPVHHKANTMQENDNRDQYKDRIEGRKSRESHMMAWKKGLSRLRQAFGSIFSWKISPWNPFHGKWKHRVTQHSSGDWGKTSTWRYLNNDWHGSLTRSWAISQDFYSARGLLYWKTHAPCLQSTPWSNTAVSPMLQTTRTKTQTLKWW